jgi:hypothetical protein
VKLDIRSVQQRKVEAFKKHVSQGPVMETSRELFEKFGHEEFYALVAGEGVEEMRIMHDMFEGWGG